MSAAPKTTEPRLSLSASAARNLATATVTVPQMTEITPRWLHRLLPWVDVDGGVYRANHVAKAAKGAPANEFGEVKVDLLTVNGSEAKLPTTFVDYEENPREYHLSTIQTVLRTHTRVTDLYSNRIDQLRQQIRLLHEVAPSQRISTRKGTPTPDDLDELLTLVWKKPAFFLAHPKAIAAFGRECTRRGVPPAIVHLFGSPFLTWRGVPLVPSNKLPINRSNGSRVPHVANRDTEGSAGLTSILLMRVGEPKQGVVGLHQTGLPGEQMPGLSVRFMGIDNYSTASYLVTLYFSAAVLTEDALGILENVEVGNYHDDE
jgi:hypothetical protein